MTEQQLKRYSALKAEVDSLKESIQRLESELSSAKIPAPSGFPPGGVRRLMSDNVIKLESLKEKYARLLNKRIIECRTIEDAINQLVDPRHRNILRLKYIEGLKMEVICVKIGYEWAQTNRLHKEALEKLKNDTQ